MDSTKLTSMEIERKIISFTDRLNTLHEIIKEIGDENAKAALLDQAKRYNHSLEQFKKELLSRLVSQNA